MPLVLASASPARLATLRSAGVEPVVIVSGVDEDQLGDLPPAELALQLAELKCAAVAERATACPTTRSCSAATRCSSSTARRSASRTTPPRRPGAGRRCAAAPACCTPVTACATPRPATSPPRRRRPPSTSPTSPTTRSRRTSRTGEPLHVAGAFTVDGLGGAFVTGIEGDHHNVVGLSLPLVRDLLAELGRSWTDLWISRELLLHLVAA